jgi:hypothetical protein
MRSSCIQHPEREPLAILRKSYIDLCRGNRCAAMLLSDFEYWHNYRLDRVDQEIARARDNDEYKPDLSLWVYKSAPDLIEDLLGEYGRNSILVAVELLLELGFVITRSDPKDSFSRTRFFQFVPDAVNEALRGWESSLGKDATATGPAPSLKTNSRQFESKRSAENKPSGVRKQIDGDTKGDALPYTEITSSEITSSSSSEPQGSLAMELMPNDDEADLVGKALAAFVAASLEEEKRVIELAWAADPTLTAEEVALAVTLSVPAKVVVQHVNYFFSAVPKLIASRRWRMVSEERRGGPVVAVVKPAEPVEPLDETKRWDRVRSALQGRLTPESYENWFARSRQVVEMSSSAIVVFPDADVAEYVKGEYQSLIVDVCCQMGEPSEFTFTADNAPVAPRGGSGAK